MGRVYEHQGNYRQALAAYNAALGLEPLYLPATQAKRVLLGRLN
jgi:hypothetical protein